VYDLVGGHVEPSVKRLRVLLRREEFGSWIAQCLEHNIVAQGSSIPGAIRCFVATLVAQIRLDLERHRLPLESVPPAPREYESQYASAVALREERSQDLDREFRGIPPAYQIARLTEEFRVHS
jgi:hypothetical protein